MSRNTADISGALELLREGLGPFVAREVQHRAPRDRIEKFISSKHRRVRDKLRNRPVFEWEVSILLDLMNQLWDNVFARTLEPMERNFVVELLSWRNNSAHQEPVDEDRFFDTAVRLLRAVEAETQAAEVARLRESRRAANAPTERVRGSAVAQSHGPAYRPPLPFGAGVASGRDSSLRTGELRHAVARIRQRNACHPRWRRRARNGAAPSYAQCLQRLGRPQVPRPSQPRSRMPRRPAPEHDNHVLLPSKLTRKIGSGPPASALVV